MEIVDLHKASKLLEILTKKVDQISLMQTVQMSASQKQAASEAFKAVYLDFDGLKKVTFDSVANEFDLCEFAEHSC